MDSENHPLFSPSRVRREFCAIILPVSRITGDIRIEFPPLCIRAYQLKAFRISSAGMNYKFLFIKPRIVSLKSRTYYPRRNALCCVRVCVCARDTSNLVNDSVLLAQVPANQK